MLNFFMKFLATGFYTGTIPKAPGTFGSLAACAIYCLIGVLFPEQSGTFIALVFAFGTFPAIIICDFAEKMFSEKDPQRVVIDEFFGLWLSFIFLPFSFKTALLGFLLFRFFDIVKPFPINSVQKIKGGLGIMFDDIIAGTYSRILLGILLYFKDYLPFSLF